MKTALLRRRIHRFVNYAPYPNAATPRQMAGKALDVLLVAASGAGLAAMVLLLSVM